MSAIKIVALWPQETKDAWRDVALWLAQLQHGEEQSAGPDSLS